MGLGGPELLVAALWLVPVAVGVATIVSANRLPESAFRAADSSKNMWIVLPLVGGAVCGILSIVMAVIWFGGTRQKVAAAAG